MGTHAYSGKGGLLRPSSRAIGALTFALYCAVTSPAQEPKYDPWTMLKLPDTGQTKRFTETPGEDGFYTINPPSYKVNGDGTVDDLVTGLEWQQADGGEMSWENAISYCRDLKLAGKRDWRLPNTHELFSIQDHSRSFPSFDVNVFTKSDAEYWWASNQRLDRADYAWATNAGGGAGAHPKKETLSSGGSKSYHARCVRGAALTGKGATELYTDNRDGTVSDNRTGLMWQKTEGLSAATWEEALAYANALVLAGHNDWRLPNIKELHSLETDYAVMPSIDTAYFPDTPAALYWSSTTLAGHTQQAWTVQFRYGVVSYNPKTDKLHVRAVRSGVTR